MPKSADKQFDELVAPHLTTLFRAAYRLVRNRADADDLVQETCLTACESLAALQAARHPDHWLLRVLYNRFVDGARRRKRNPVIALDGADGRLIGGNGPSCEELLQRDEAETALQNAYLQLEETQRAVLALRAEGYGLEEIEAITGVGKEVLRARLHRARKSLARLLDQPEHIQPEVEASAVVRLGSKR